MNPCVQPFYRCKQHTHSLALESAGWSSEDDDVVESAIGRIELGINEAKDLLHKHKSKKTLKKLRERFFRLKLGEKERKIELLEETIKQEKESIRCLKTKKSNDETLKHQLEAQKQKIADLEKEIDLLKRRIIS